MDRGDRRSGKKLSASEEMLRAARDALESELASRRAELPSDLRDLSRDDVAESLGDAVAEGRRAVEDLAAEGRQAMSDVVEEARQRAREAVEKARDRTPAGPRSSPPPRPDALPPPAPPQLRRPRGARPSPAPPAPRNRRTRIRPGWIFLVVVFILSIVRRLF